MALLSHFHKYNITELMAVRPRNGGKQRFH
jgi:hypothetical protein